MATGVTSSRLVGRELELAQLEAALADAAAGQPSLAFVVGESGVGKTRLVTELAERARAGGSRVLRGDCVQLGEGELAYAPLVSALRPLARDADPVLTGLGPEVLAELGTLLPGIAAAREQGVRPGEQARVFEALLAVLDGLSREQPLLLIIEDLHWADASTRAFLRFLAAALGREPLLVVATYRPDELHRRHPLRPLVADLERTRALRVDLGGFTRDELVLQLESILGTEPDAALVDRLFARSEGNPLFAEELLAAGVDGRGAVPPSLADALALRIEKLSPDAQELVRVLSAGGALGDAVLGEVTGMEPRALRDALREAVASHIVVPEGECYVLRHALLREAVHDDLLPGERAELHLALARALEAQDGPLDNQRAASIAHHYHAAGDQPAALAAAVRAGQSAIEVQAYREGAALFERALELWDRVPEAQGLAGMSEAALLERASICHFYADDHARSVTLLKRALALVDEDEEPRRAAWLHGLLHRSLWGMLRQEEATRMLDRGLALLEADGPSPERAGLLARRARSLMVQSRYHAAVRVARQALGEQARLEEPGGRYVDEIGALNALGVSLMATGGIEEGAEALRRALDMAQRSHRALDITSTAVNLSDALHHVGRTPEALEVAREARAQLAELPIREAWLSLLISQQAFDAGDWDTVEEMLRAVGRRRPKGGTARARLHAAAGGARAGARRARGGAGGPGARGRAGRRLPRAAVPGRARRAAGRARDARGRRRGRARRGRRGARPDRVLLRRRAADGDGLGRRAGGRGRRRPARARPRRRGGGRGGAHPRRAADRPGAGVRRGRRAARAGLPRERGGGQLPGRGAGRPGALRGGRRARGRSSAARTARRARCGARRRRSWPRATARRPPLRSATRWRSRSGSAPRGSAASSRAWSRAAGCGRAATRTAPARRPTTSRSA